jgi:glycosyltransferase involved in cell wall biosynthesis
MSIDGFPRWDLVIPQFGQIDTNLWKPKDNYNENNGYKGVVKIIHTPNHRGFKGTEFIINAVEELKKEGLKVELILLERVQNDKVREIMQQADILVEQLIFVGYALSAIEGMATGLPVLANLENEEYTRVFRLYSFLDECPILSTTPETIKDNLKLLVTNYKLRKELGQLGRKYVEKYHSYKMTQYLFSNIFKKLEGENIDLINLFHPLKSEYVKNNYIKTPLYKNKYIFRE